MVVCFWCLIYATADVSFRLRRYLSAESLRSFQPLQTDRQSKAAHLSAHALPSLDHNFPINRYTARSASALATYTAFVIHISSVTAMLKFLLYLGEEEDVVESQICAVEQMVGDDCVAVARKTHAF